MDVVAQRLEQEEKDLHYWQIERFQELGFERHQAEILELARADWHEAEALLRQGCSHEHAIELLT